MKLVVIGLDGLIPEVVAEFSKKGVIPNIARLIKNGVFARSLPVQPTITSTNWATLSTGSYPASHGIDCFAGHKPGDPAGQYFRYFFHPHDRKTKNPVKAETIWEAGNKAGKKFILVNWLFAYPDPADKNAVIVETPPVSKEAEIYPAYEYGTSSDPNAIKERSLRIKIDAPAEWKNAGNHKILWESEIKLSNDQDAPRYHIAAMLSADKAGCAISKTRDLKKACAVLAENEWSPWIDEKIHKLIEWRNPANNFEWLSKAIKVKCIFRFKLKKLDIKNKKILVYRTPVVRCEGWSYPEDLGPEIIRAYFGEFGEDYAAWKLGRSTVHPRYEGANPIAYEKDNFPLRDSEKINAAGFTACYLAKKRKWDSVFVQVHAPDTMNHYEMGQITPESKHFRKDDFPKHWKVVQEEHRAMDRMVGKIVKKLSRKDTVFAVISDHGCIACDRQVWIPKFLIDKGYMKYVRTDDGKYKLDIRNSKAWVSDSPAGNYIWLNLKGRDPDGIVEPRDADRLLDDIMELMLSIRDPENGRCPFACVLRGRDAYNIGLKGETVGDIVYTHGPGYMQQEFQCLGPATEREYRDFNQTGFQDTGYNYPGCHGMHWTMPNAFVGKYSNAGVFIAAGGGFKKGHKRSKNIWMADVIPTLCAAANFPVPKDADGRIVLEMLK